MTAPERRLALLLCGTDRWRTGHGDEIAALVAQVDPGRLVHLLDELRLSALIGRRLLDLGVAVDPGLAHQLTARIEHARRDGTGQELISLAILARLEQAGIRALGLKGRILARQIYDEPGARSAADIDILVAAEDLDHAVEAVVGMGWRHDRVASRARRLPVLHETLSREGMPQVELHWRIHWYERQFAADALARAHRAGPHQPLVLTPADGLAALLLFYARDGFYGLRLAADVAAWWDRCCGADDPGMAAVAAAYPALAAPLRVAAGLLAELVGLPLVVPPLAADSARERLAAALATPFPDTDSAQVLANASLVDLLLSPSGQRAQAIGRELQKIPEDLERPLRPTDGLPAYLARSEHGLRVLRRWLIALAPAMRRLR